MTIRELANKCVFIGCNECKHHKECDEFMKTHIMTPGSYLPYMDVNWDADILVKETTYNSIIRCKDCKYHTDKQVCTNRIGLLVCYDDDYCSLAKKG